MRRRSPVSSGRPRPIRERATGRPVVHSARRVQPECAARAGGGRAADGSAQSMDWGVSGTSRRDAPAQDAAGRSLRTRADAMGHENVWLPCGAAARQAGERHMAGRRLRRRGRLVQLDALSRIGVRARECSLADPRHRSRGHAWHLVGKPNLTRVDEVGFADLTPGSGHGWGGFVNVSRIEVFGASVAR